MAVESGERPGRQASAAKPPAVADERVGERDERVEDDRPAPCCMLGRGQVEVTGVADEHHVEGLLGRPSQPGLGRSEPKGDPRARPPLVLAPVPDRLVPLAHPDARPAQARNHLSVPRIASLIGSEVEDDHPSPSLSGVCPRALVSGEPGFARRSQSTRSRVRRAGRWNRAASGRLRSRLSYRRRPRGGGCTGEPEVPP